MPAVLDLLKVLLQPYLRVKLTIFINIILILDLLVVRKLCNRLLMFFFQLCQPLLICRFCFGLLSFAAGLY